MAKKDRASSGKKPIYKRKWFWALIVLVVIIGAGSSEEDKAPEEDPAKIEDTAPTKTDTPEPVRSEPEPVRSEPEPSEPDEEKEEEPAKKEFSVEELSDLIEIVLSKNFENYQISSEDTTIVVNIWAEGIALELAAIQTSGGGADDESWMELKNGIGAMSDSICSLIDESGREDVYFFLNLLNDQNQENILLSMLDSEIIYDVLA